MSDKYDYFNPMPQHRFIERHLVTLVIKELATDGWELEKFEDEGHEVTNVSNAEEAWAAFDSVETGWLHFDNGLDTAWIFLVGGNGADVISDCTTNITAPLDRVFLY